MEIKKFAVSTNYQDTWIRNEGQGDQLISDVILWSIIGDIYEMAKNVLGIEMIMLYSVPKAIAFYERNLFSPLGEYKAFSSDYTEGCMPMYLKLF